MRDIYIDIVTADTGSCQSYVQDSVFSFLLLLLGVLHPPGEVVHKDELNEGGIDEEHADPFPHDHGCQIGDHREVGAESETIVLVQYFYFSQDVVLVRDGEEIEHGGDTEGDAGRFSVPLNPKGDEGRCYKNQTFGNINYL